MRAQRGALRRRAPALAGIAAWLTAASALAIPKGNLLVNPGAEEGKRGWCGSLTTVPYYPQAPGLSTPSQRPTADAGGGIFESTADSPGSQIIDVRAWGREVDTDSILVALGAYITPAVRWALSPAPQGSWTAAGQVEVRFYDRIEDTSVAGCSLPGGARDLGREVVVNTAEEPGIDNIDPVTGDRTGTTPVPLIRRYATAVVPKGTRAIMVFLLPPADTARRRGGVAHFDVLSLELSYTRPLQRPVLRTLPVRVRRGRVLRVIGTGWIPGETVTLMSASGKPFRSVRASAAGRFGMLFDVKRTARRGRVTMVACQRGCTLRAVARFRVIS